MGGRHPGDLGVVVGRGDLDDVAADHVRPAQPAQDLEHLPAGHAAGLGGPGAGGVGRVQHVDVQRDVERAVADALAQVRDDGVHPQPHDVGGGDDAEAEAGVVVEVLGAVERPAGADVAHGVRVEQALLERPAEGGAVGVLGAEVGVPGVQVGVEVQQRDLAVARVGGAQQRQGDGVVAADRHEPGVLAHELLGLGLDGGDRLGDVEGVGHDVPGVGDLRPGERRDVLRGVVGAQQARGLPDVVGPEPGAGPVGDAGVERHAHHRDVRVLDLVRARQAGERAQPGPARGQGGVDGSDDGGAVRGGAGDALGVHGVRSSRWMLTGVLTGVPAGAADGPGGGLTSRGSTAARRPRCRGSPRCAVRSRGR